MLLRPALSMAGIVAATLGCSAPVPAAAEENCDAIVARLSGTQADGQGTLDLERKAQLGNCTAAAQLVRRAADAQGYAKVHCTSTIEDVAAEILKLGRAALDTPQCQG